jgi:hypothetical protein
MDYEGSGSPKFCATGTPRKKSTQAALDCVLSLLKHHPKLPM